MLDFGGFITNQNQMTYKWIRGATITDSQLPYAHSAVVEDELGCKSVLIIQS